MSALLDALVREHRLAVSERSGNFGGHLGVRAGWVDFDAETPVESCGTCDIILAAGSVARTGEASRLAWAGLAEGRADARAYHLDPVYHAVASRLIAAGVRLGVRGAVPPCPCECNSGGFCGGCGHAGCGGRR